LFLLHWISFRGRIPLGRYWLAYLLPLFALNWVALGIDLALFGRPLEWSLPPVGLPAARAAGLDEGWSAAVFSGPVSTAWTWLSLVPGFAGMTKRWHDRGRSGWWSLLLLLPVIGWVWMLVSLCFRDGVRGPNRFGPDPLEPKAPA
jgi:uncharacterized membrane protein YhaH (DUF805 family)